MKKIILASSSPRRKQLLEQIGLKFKIIPSNIDEKLNPRLQPTHQAEQLSIEKAKKVGEKNPNAIIIAADTFVVLKNEILGKPTSKQDAKRMLKKLSGKTHSVITGFTILDTDSGKIVTKSLVTKMYMKRLIEKEIDAYIESGEPLDKAGAYAAQEKGAMFIEKIEGDFFNVVGLPLFTLVKELKKFDLVILA